MLWNRRGALLQTPPDRAPGATLRRMRYRVRGRIWSSEEVVRPFVQNRGNPDFRR